MTNSFWFALPLIACVSLVYAATRHEDVGDILQHALRVAIWITGFMILVFGILFAISKLVS
jgi:spore maturation protein SpmA